MGSPLVAGASHCTVTWPSPSTKVGGAGLPGTSRTTYCRRPCTWRCGSLVASWMVYTTLTTPMNDAPGWMVTSPSFVYDMVALDSEAFSMWASVTVNGWFFAANGLTSLASTFTVSVTPRCPFAVSAIACGNGFDDDTTVTLTMPGTLKPW